LFNLKFVQKLTWRVRVTQSYLCHIALSASEYYWDERVLLFHNYSTDLTLTKQRFGKIFNDPWHKAATPANTKEGFQATGLYPFNPSIIPDEASAPRLVTHNEDAQVYNAVTLTETPAPAPVSQKKNKARKDSPLLATVAPS
jgi:hypothetical protein